jgi:hypothetical protein
MMFALVFLDLVSHQRSQHYCWSSRVKVKQLDRRSCVSRVGLLQKPNLKPRDGRFCVGRLGRRVRSDPHFQPRGIDSVLSQTTGEGLAFICAVWHLLSWWLMMCYSCENYEIRMRTQTLSWADRLLMRSQTSTWHLAQLFPIGARPARVFVTHTVVSQFGDCLRVATATFATA